MCCLIPWWERVLKRPVLLLCCVSFLCATGTPLAGELEPPPSSPQTPGETLFLPKPVLMAQSAFRAIRAPELQAPPEQPRDRTVRYRILVEKGLEDTAQEFVQTVDTILQGEQSWRAANVGFVRVEKKADISILLARSYTVDNLCLPLKTGGVLSCGIYRRANLNVYRWRNGAPTWGDDLDGYRRYLVLHEVGHLLGLGHEKCPRRGEPAPIMLPQTKRLEGCTPNGAPTDHEIKRLGNMKLRTARRKRRRGKARKVTVHDEP